MTIHSSLGVFIIVHFGDASIKYARRFGMIVCLLAMLLVCRTVFAAQPSTIQVVADKPGLSSQKIHQLLKNRLPDRAVPPAVTSDHLKPIRPTTLITIGASTLYKTLQRVNSLSSLSQMQIVALQVPEEIYQLIVVKVPSETPITAIYRDAPLQRQLALIAAIVPFAKTVGMLQLRDKQYHELLTFAPKIGLNLTFELIPTKEALPKHVERLVKRSDILLATSDQQLYNKDSIKTILLSSYYNNRFVVGNSERYVQAGSLASTFTATEQLVDELLVLLSELDKGAFPQARHSRAFRVVINHQVAHSLNLSVPKEHELEKKIRMLLEKVAYED